MAAPEPDPVESDEALMLAFAAGDMAAFDTLYARHRRGLYGFLGRMVPATMLDDLFQDVWLRVAKSRASYRPQAQFRTWLFQIAHHRAVDWLRERRPDLVTAAANDEGDDPLDAIADEHNPAPDTRLERKQVGEQLARALASLPAEQREAFLLREHSEMSLEEIATLTGVNAETAKSRLRYAINKLRVALKGTWP